LIREMVQYQLMSDKYERGRPFRLIDRQAGHGIEELQFMDRATQFPSVLPTPEFSPCLYFP
jgi:hypothetical protein